MRTIALFDLDGTLTRTDTMLEFLAFTKGRWRSWVLLSTILPLWCLAKLKVLDRDAPKRAFVRKAFAGASVDALQEYAERFTHEVMPRLLRPGAQACIRQHLADGHEVVIVTASCSLWVQPWCRLQRIGLIATELEKRDHRFTGRLATPNCKGDEKVRRIHERLGDSASMDILAYGDTPSDRPMLALAKMAYYKPFR